MKPLIQFIGVAVCLYAVVIVLLFVGMGSVAEKAFVATGNMFFGKHWEHVRIVYKADTSIPHTDIRSYRASNIIVTVSNTNILLTNGQYAQGSMNLSSFNWGYLPLALITILCIATPVSLKRRGILLLIGVVCVEFFLLTLQWYILWVYAEINNFGWYGFTPETKQNILMPILQSTLVNGIGITFTVPFIVWLVLVIVRKDIMILLPDLSNGKKGST